MNMATRLFLILATALALSGTANATTPTAIVIDAYAPATTAGDVWTARAAELGAIVAAPHVDHFAPAQNADAVWAQRAVELTAGWDVK